jgi:class 3 adenylate cyclase/pimeloyl-ACP methyl ester carboxylesterase
VRTPHTRYAHSGDASIAYQVFGTGDIDLVIVNGPASHLELAWEDPATASSFQRLGTFARVVMFDRRGTGLSDAVDRPPTLEQQMDDLLAVLGAVGVDRTALSGGSDAGLAAMFAATYPERVTALSLWGVAAHGRTVDDPELRVQLLDAIENQWADGTLIHLFVPSQVGNRAFEEWWGRFQRGAVSPGMARKIMDMESRVDLRAILPTIRVPTLVSHRSGDRFVPVELGRELAALIPGARFREFPGIDNYGWVDSVAWLDELEEFLTGGRRPREVDRVLSTVMFTDIVGSTEHASRLGDGRWRRLLDEHNGAVRSQLAQWRGTEVKTIGDGFLATFDGPARAVKCAEGIVEAVEALGLKIRTGLHTGECELIGDDVAGIAVHIGARVMEQAEPGEILASSTVKDLVVGSGLQFCDRGTHALKGVPDQWHLYALEREG